MGEKGLAHAHRAHDRDVGMGYGIPVDGRNFVKSTAPPGSVLLLPWKILRQILRGT
jgi:hypothetical protein